MFKTKQKRPCFETSPFWQTLAFLPCSATVGARDATERFFRSFDFGASGTLPGSALVCSFQRGFRRFSSRGFRGCCETTLPAHSSDPEAAKVSVTLSGVAGNDWKTSARWVRIQTRTAPAWILATAGTPSPVSCRVLKGGSLGYLYRRTESLGTASLGTRKVPGKLQAVFIWALQVQHLQGSPGTRRRSPPCEKGTSDLGWPNSKQKLLRFCSYVYTYYTYIRLYIYIYVYYVYIICIHIV